MKLSQYSTNYIIIPFKCIHALEKQKIPNFTISNPISNFSVSFQQNDKIFFEDIDDEQHIIKKKKANTNAAHCAIIGNMIVIDLDEFIVTDVDKEKSDKKLFG